jgi:hypothetical protein
MAWDMAEMTRIEYMESLPEGTIGAEIGVLEGEFSAQILATPVKKLYLVDPWKHYETGYDDSANVNQGGQDHRYRNVCAKFAGDPRAIILREESGSQVVMDAIQDVDWVYIDANHSYEAVWNDLTWYSEMCDLLMLHDYCENDITRGHGWGVIRAVEDWLAVSKWKKVLVTDEDWPTVVLKK